MSLDRGTVQRRVVRRMPGRDAVVVVRQALERAEEGYPLFPGTEAETRAALVVLEERLKRLKSRGINVEGIELNHDVRHLLAGGGRMPLAC
jgi:hypothetical protein